MMGAEVELSNANSWKSLKDTLRIVFNDSNNEPWTYRYKNGKIGGTLPS